MTRIKEQSCDFSSSIKAIGVFKHNNVIIMFNSSLDSNKKEVLKNEIINKLSYEEDSIVML